MTTTKSDEMINLEFHGPNRERVQVIRCTEKKCSRVMRTKAKGKLKPADVIMNMARRKGWKIDVNKKTAVCPNHAKEDKPKMRLEDLKQLKGNEEIAGVPVDNKDDKVVQPQIVGQNGKSEEKPRELTQVFRRKIFREIDGSYENNRYVTGVTDKTIADELNVPRKWVEDIREEMFGPAGPNPEVVAISEQLVELARAATKLEIEGLKLAEEAEALRKKGQELEQKLAEIK